MEPRTLRFRVSILVVGLLLLLSGQAKGVVNVNVWVLIDHASRSDLVLEMGVGDPANPDFVTVLQSHQTNPTFPFNENINQIYDGDVPDALWPPPPGAAARTGCASGMKRWGISASCATGA